MRHHSPFLPLWLKLFWALQAIIYLKISSLSSAPLLLLNRLYLREASCCCCSKAVTIHIQAPAQISGREHTRMPSGSSWIWYLVWNASSSSSSHLLPMVNPNGHSLLTSTLWHVYSLFCINNTSSLRRNMWKSCFFIHQTDHLDTVPSVSPPQDIMLQTWSIPFPLP